MEHQPPPPFNPDYSACHHTPPDKYPPPSTRTTETRSMITPFTWRNSSEVLKNVAGSTMRTAKKSASFIVRNARQIDEKHNVVENSKIMAKKAAQATMKGSKQALKSVSTMAIISSIIIYFLLQHGSR